MVHIGEEAQKDVAELYGLTPGRISQIKKQIDRKLILARVKEEEIPDVMNIDLGVIEL